MTDGHSVAKPPFNTHVWSVGLGGLVFGPPWQFVLDRSTLLVAAGGDATSHINIVSTQFSGITGSPTGKAVAVGFRLSVTLD